MKITIKDFLNSEGSPRNPFVLLLAMILAIILGPFVFAGIYLFKLLPLVVLQFLIIMLGFIVFIYFVIMVKDTAKSIKKEKFKTTIKTRVDGFVVLSIFMFCIFAYVYKT